MALYLYLDASIWIFHHGYLLGYWAAWASLGTAVVVAGLGVRGTSEHGAAS